MPGAKKILTTAAIVLVVMALISRTATGRKYVLNQTA